MFTSNNTLNPFTSSSSSYNLSPYIIDHEIINNHNNNNYNVFFNIPPISPQFISTMQNIEASNNVINGDQHQQHDPPFVEKSVKKDRHSKIYTAHGLRDRRVRLSIEISRKFFDLQDMLGFDKASKTLEWLLTKSGEAIKELEGAKSLSSSSTTFEEGVVSKKDQPMAASDDKRKKKIKIKKVAAAKESNPVAKESRAKARERARERTRVRKLHDDMLNQSISSILNPQHQIQGAFCNDSVKIVHDHHQVMEELPANNSHISSSSSLANPIPKRNIIEESIVIKRKLKPCTMMGYQQNLVMFKDVSCNNNLMTNFSQHWDINSAIAHSSYRTAALRQAMGG